MIDLRQLPLEYHVQHPVQQTDYYTIITYSITLSSYNYFKDLRQLALEHRVEQTGEVAVHPFIPRDQLVGEGEPMHETGGGV